MSRRKPAGSVHQLKVLGNRQLDERNGPKLQSRLHVTESLISRLGLEKELEGHTGCVNCLEWNESGSVLASASDDVRFILWDPFRYKRLHTFETGHRGNIFTVKFLPKTKDNTIVTGAGDCRVRVHDVTLSETTLVCSCHTGRVKRVATAPNLPYMFWSAGEDGMIMEFDLRAPHTCTAKLNNLLINLPPHLGRIGEAKCLAINPCRPELLAVGANDPYIRLFDRRMIRPVTVEYAKEGRPKNHFERYQYLHSRVENNLTDGCVQYFVAGHLPTQLSDLKKNIRRYSTTYLTFSPSGNELLVNLGGEQIYLFDINNKREMRTYDARLINSASSSGANGFAKSWRCNSDNGCSADSEKLGANRPPAPQCFNTGILEELKMSANKMFENHHYTSAIRLYNKAVSLCSDWALLYGNRAAAYMKRKWDGDMYAAMRDCSATLQLDPSHLKAHFRLAKCLFELNLVEEAEQCLDDFMARFPEQAHSRGCKALAMDIQTCFEAKKEKERTEMGAQFEESEECLPGSSEQGRKSKESQPNHLLSDQEVQWRVGAADYEARYCGHCNTTTDIKEANFFGSEGQYIVAGSDDGSFFIWDRHTTNIVQVLRGDDSIVNCLQPHPSACLLATSGIDPVVRLWSPLPENGLKNDRAVLNLDDAASANQKRMNSDPFELMLLNMGYRIASPVEGGEDSALEEPNWVPSNINCRTS